MTGQFRIFTVCTGNVCRSPLAERLLQSGFDYAAPGAFAVSSAGTGALVGSSVTPQIRNIARSLGVNIDQFVARQLSPEHVEYVDLVLTLSRSHSSSVLEEHPHLLKKTFTVREFARILPTLAPDLEANPVDRWRKAVQKAPRKRQAAVDVDADDVVDPYRQPDEVYQAMARQLVPAVRTLIEWELKASRRG